MDRMVLTVIPGSGLEPTTPPSETPQTPRTCLRGAKRLTSTRFFPFLRFPFFVYRRSLGYSASFVVGGFLLFRFWFSLPNWTMVLTRAGWRSVLTASGTHRAVVLRGSPVRCTVWRTQRPFSSELNRPGTCNLIHESVSLLAKLCQLAISDYATLELSGQHQLQPGSSPLLICSCVQALVIPFTQCAVS
jgi:hypothetical protein